MASVIAKLPQAALEAGLRGKNILVIGGTAGIGKALAVACLQNGAEVTVVGRRAPDADLQAARYVQKDLSTMKNAASLADELDVSTTDAIVFTNGIFSNPARQVSPEGIELDLAVSYLSRYVFARKLLSKDFGSARKDTTHKPRIFVMGFPGAKVEVDFTDFNSERNYSAMTAHMNTVASNEALVTYLAQEFKGAVNVYGLGPGIIKTDIRANFLGGLGSWKHWLTETLIGWFTPTAAYYAENTLLHLLVTDELEDRQGALIDQKRNIIQPNPFVGKDGNVERIMAESAKLADRALESE